MYNYHTHTLYCDGSSDPELYIKSAIEKNMKVLGFSAHAPVPFDNEWSLKLPNVKKYCNCISDLKEKYKKEITVLHGLEIDYIPNITTDFEIVKNNFNLDYTVGSIHLVRSHENDKLWFIDGPKSNFDTGLMTIFGNDIQKGVTAFYKQTQEMIIKQKPDIIGHFDKIKMHNNGRFFSEDESWYRAIVDETLKIVASSACIIELNTRGVYTGNSKTFFPSVYILEKCLQLNIPIMLNSDSHKPDQLTLKYEEALDLLKDIGLKKLCVIQNGKHKNIDIDIFMTNKKG